jgi:hypothetical protein
VAKYCYRLGLIQPRPRLQPQLQPRTQLVWSITVMGSQSVLFMPKFRFDNSVAAHRSLPLVYQTTPGFITNVNKVVNYFGGLNRDRLCRGLSTQTNAAAPPKSNPDQIDPKSNSMGQTKLDPTQPNSMEPVKLVPN